MPDKITKNKKFKVVLPGLIIFLIVFGLSIFNFRKTEKIEAGSEHNVWGWAWSENIGWISFNCNNSELPAPRCTNNYGVHICAAADPLPLCFGLPVRTLVGHAWSENIGWISFNLSETGNPPGEYDYSSDGYIAELLPNNQLRGWARALAFGDGWDGWIKLKCFGAECATSNYGVTLDPTPDPDEFEDWAWGSDVIGWISFNCENCEGATCNSYPICGNFAHPDYKVITSFVSGAPSVTNPHETFDTCAYGTIPQVAPGLSVTLHWTYSDPEGNPQRAYEIWVDDNLADLDNPLDPKFNYSVVHAPLLGPDFAYTLNLNNDQEGDWLSQLSWNTTYYWKVRAGDTAGNWSAWSIKDSLDTPEHAYPYVNFSWSPQSPSVGEVVQFNDTSECYDAAGNIVPCESWSWTFEDGDPATSTLQNPETKFTSSGSKDVDLTVTDSDVFSCFISRSLNIGLPLPGWKEIPPF